eukprot:NODE_16465_length_204_cov_5.735484_g15551_i0.p3 GENE.NODE_16465_length_204_cov_5.735484_g15551_i0~~NODE_16465_length_204_cov_5.735484_g15551_i0.p3  ORF type:complete len:54 (+),score=7.39 NODE_16465_length_204_cov_5.735484_g15551_i0:23-163(+)
MAFFACQVLIFWRFIQTRFPSRRPLKCCHGNDLLRITWGSFPQALL